MTKYEIIDMLSKNKLIEKFISNTAKTSNEDLNDLAQDVYLILLEYDDEKIERMWENDELEYFVARIICNQIKSTTSPYYSKYRKWANKRSDLKGEIKIKEIIEKEQGWMRKQNCENY